MSQREAHRLGHIAGGIGLAASLLLMVNGRALAHASLVDSDPVQGAALDHAPQEIVLHFSEEVDPTFSHVDLLDANGSTVIPGPGTVDADGLTLRLKVSSLPDGVYNAVWETRSAVDGHVTSGTVGFAVGVSAVPPLPPPGTPDPATTLPQPVDSLVRWLGYLSLALAQGAILFALLVWRPAVKISGTEWPRAENRVTRLLRRLALAGIGGLAAATVGMALVQASQASGVGFPAVLGAPLLQLMATRSGTLLLMRIGLLAALAVLAWRLPLPGERMIWWWAAAALGLGVALTFSLQSHSAATGPLLAVVLDTLHLLAMSAWVGGLPPLTLILSRCANAAPGWPPLRSLVPAFSRVALVSVDALALSGGYSAIRQVQNVDALLATTYGRALIVKSGLFALLIGLGTLNLLVLTPRLRRLEWETGSTLRISTRVEVALGLLALLAAGVMTGVEPAAQALAARQQSGFLASATEDRVRLVLHIAPAAVGVDAFTVDVDDRRPGVDDVPGTVLLRVHVVNPNPTPNQIDMTTTDGKRFTAHGAYLTRVGEWRIFVILRRPGFDDVTHRFDLLLPGQNDAPGG